MNFNFEYLKHGKALCGKVFKRFVETFNFHNDFISNLKGDADLPTEGGHVTVDTTDSSHPVIRCRGCEVKVKKKKSAPFPFEYMLVNPEQDEGEDENQTETPRIVNCTFYWDGEMKNELSDFEPPETCTVYLCCTQDAPSSSDPDPDWEFSIDTEEAEAPEGGRVINYKLYDIEDKEVTMDYRTTFLELNSPHERAEIVVKKPDADESRDVCVIADASSDVESKIEVRNNKAAEKHISATVLSSGSYFTVANGSQRNARMDVEDGNPSLVLRRDSKKRLFVHDCGYSFAA